MTFTVRESAVDGQSVLEVAGEVDMHTAAELRDRIHEAIDAGERPVILDLSPLSFIDSTGLGALVSGLNHANAAEVPLRIVCPSERLLKLFRITGLHEVFALFPTVADALGSAAHPTASD